MITTLAITDRVGTVVEPIWLTRAEVVHRQLRPLLPTTYMERMKVIFSGGGEMLVVVKEDAVLGLAVFRVTEKTFYGRELYCDDLITDESKRSLGVGKQLLDSMKTIAIERGCDYFTLDSGCQRQRAHRFYFREAMTISGFHFSLPLTTL